MSGSQFLNELWRLYLAIVKGALMVVGSILALLSVIAFFATQKVALRMTTLQNAIENWHPVKPKIFDLK